MTIIVLIVAIAAAATFMTVVNRPTATSWPPPHTPAVAKPAPRPVAARAPLPERLVFELTGRKYCIGGTLCPSYCALPANACEAQAVYRIDLARPTSVSHIRLHAHDEAGVTHVAELVVTLDGREVGKLPVAWQGADLDLPIRRTGKVITIAARDPSGSRYAGEEAVISEIKVFGNPAR